MQLYTSLPDFIHKLYAIKCGMIIFLNYIVYTTSQDQIVIFFKQMHTNSIINNPNDNYEIKFKRQDIKKLLLISTYHEDLQYSLY